MKSVKHDKRQCVRLGLFNDVSNNNVETNISSDETKVHYDGQITI